MKNKAMLNFYLHIYKKYQIKKDKSIRQINLSIHMLNKLGVRNDKNTFNQFTKFFNVCQFVSF